MPVKTKAKDHSVYMKQMTHNHLYKFDHKPRRSGNGKKIAVALGVILIILLIALGLFAEV